MNPDALEMVSASGLFASETQGAAASEFMQGGTCHVTGSVRYADIQG